MSVLCEVGELPYLSTCQKIKIRSFNCSNCHIYTDMLFYSLCS